MTKSGRAKTNKICIENAGLSSTKEEQLLQKYFDQIDDN